MTEAPDPKSFSINQRDGEYIAVLHVEGEILLNIKANNRIEAESKVADVIEDLESLSELDDVHGATAVTIYKARPMYRVMLDGKKMQVTDLQPGMTPREPDERGF